MNAEESELNCKKEEGMIKVMMVPRLRRIRECSTATTSSVVVVHCPEICGPTLPAVG